MSSDIGLVELVRQLVDAENEHDKAKAHSILAQNFAAITRARGEEQDRDALLKEIADPKNPNLRRELLERDCWERVSGSLGVVRSIITTPDRTAPQAAPGRFRNVHVFENQQGDWRCVAWQVTELK